MGKLLEPSDFLRGMQHHWKEELSRLKGQAPLWRCFDCKRAIPRDELPLRCEKCSGPDLKGKKVGYRFRKIKQDAMICNRCVDKHDHLRESLRDYQFQVYAQGLERRAMQSLAVENAAKRGIVLPGGYNAN